jgi:hypothetical protein
MLHIMVADALTALLVVRCLVHWRRLSLLEQLLRGQLEPAQLQTHLQQTFPSDAAEEQLREYADKAWAALGQTSLQVRPYCPNAAGLTVAACWPLAAPVSVMG